MSFKSEMRHRINQGLSKVYPYRAIYYFHCNAYSFCNHTCTIYVKHTGTYLDLDESVFQELLRSYWNEKKNDKQYTDNTLSYDKELETEKDKLNFFDTFENKNSPAPEKEYIKTDSKEKIKELINKLPGIQSDIIKGIYLEYKTESDMAKRLNKSQADIHYHKIKALKKLSELIEDVNELTL